MSEEEGVSISFGAVIKGAVVGFIVSLVASWLVAMPFMTGTPKTPAEGEAMMKALVNSTPYLLTDLFVSLLCMAIGGYVAAGKAEGSGTFHGAVTGVVLLVVVGGMTLITSPFVPGWYTAVTLVLIIPAAALGGKMGGN